jgi:2,5-diamino-6-(ribosylamino)-4(3H)-pyrimidinone 5'-phosphate reductase
VDVAALHEASITLEGSNSFVAREAGSADLPPPAAADQLHQDFLPAHLMDRVERWMAVIDSRGRVAWTETEGGGAHLLVLVCRSTPSEYLAFLREREIPYLLAGDEHLELDLALRRLGGTFDRHVIVSTAGGLLNGALLRAGLVDEIDLQIVPIVSGVADAPAIFEGYGVAGRPVPLTLRHQESRADGSLFLRFEVRKGPA